jgi:hypothetical protein
MGIKLDTLETRISISFNESLAKLQNAAHSNDDFEKGYAAALFDVRQLISDLQSSTRLAS